MSQIGRSFRLSATSWRAFDNPLPTARDRRRQPQTRLADLAIALSPADRSQAALCRVCRLRLTASIPTNSEDIDRPAALPPRIRLLFATKATLLPKDISQEEGLSRNLGIAISSARPLEHLPDASALRPLLQQLVLNRSSVLFVVRPVLQLAVEAISLLTERDHAQLGRARSPIEC